MACPFVISDAVCVPALVDAGRSPALQVVGAEQAPVLWRGPAGAGGCWLRAPNRRRNAGRGTEPGRGRTARLHVTAAGTELLTIGQREITEADRRLLRDVPPESHAQLVESLLAVRCPSQELGPRLTPPQRRQCREMVVDRHSCLREVSAGSPESKTRVGKQRRSTVATAIVDSRAAPGEWTGDTVLGNPTMVG
jgi:hypothetical protein